jgi:hypothetical protein
LTHIHAFHALLGILLFLFGVNPLGPVGLDLGVLDLVLGDASPRLSLLVLFLEHDDNVAALGVPLGSLNINFVLEVGDGESVLLVLNLGLEDETGLCSEGKLMLVEVGETDGDVDGVFTLGPHKSRVNFVLNHCLLLINCLI